VFVEKFVSVLVMSVLFAGSVFAMDLSVGLKGILGADNSDVKGTCIGGGFDINVDIKNGFGFQIESNIVPAVITKENEGLTFTDNMIVNIPAMAWYNARFSWFGFGAGAGVSCTISENHPENVSNTKLGLAAGLKAKAFVSDNIAIVAGVTGNLDCLPNLKKTSKENSSTYKFVATDFSRNAIFASIGVEYKFSL
jgi:hypothetical protein